MPDTENTDLVVCPYCGYEDRDSGEFPDSGNDDCAECGKEMHIEREVTVTYTTTKVTK